MTKRAVSAGLSVRCRCARRQQVTSSATSAPAASRGEIDVSKSSSRYARGGSEIERKYEEKEQEGREARSKKGEGEREKDAEVVSNQRSMDVGSRGRERQEVGNSCK